MGEDGADKYYLVVLIYVGDEPVIVTANIENSEITHILHQALRMEFWGYTNEVRLRGLARESRVL
jgi:hypothetical protein